MMNAILHSLQAMFTKISHTLSLLYLSFLSSLSLPLLSLLLCTQGGDCGITGKNEADDFLRLMAAMEILHFTPEDKDTIFRLLSCILHLGNVFFQRYEVLGLLPSVQSTKTSKIRSKACVLSLN